MCFAKLKWTSRNPPWTGLWKINICRQKYPIFPHPQNYFSTHCGSKSEDNSTTHKICINLQRFVFIFGGIDNLIHTQLCGWASLCIFSVPSPCNTDLRSATQTFCPINITTIFHKSREYHNLPLLKWRIRFGRMTNHGIWGALAWHQIAYTLTKSETGKHYEPAPNARNLHRWYVGFTTFTPSHFPKPPAKHVGGTLLLQLVTVFGRLLQGVHPCIA